MTLKELWKRIRKVERKLYVDQLKEGCYDIAAQAEVEGATILVTSTGQVIYKIGTRMTTFPLSECGGYRYISADGEIVEVPRSDFEEMDWTVRVLMEGEKRLEENFQRYVRCYETTEGIGRDGTCEDALSNDKRLISAAKYSDPIDEIIEREDFEEKISKLSESRKELARELYWENKSCHEVAEEYGKTYNAVKHMEYQIRKAIRKELEKK